MLVYLSSVSKCDTRNMTYETRCWDSELGKHTPCRTGCLKASYEVFMLTEILKIMTAWYRQYNAGRFRSMVVKLHWDTGRKIDRWCDWFILVITIFLLFLSRRWIHCHYTHHLHNPLWLNLQCIYCAISAHFFAVICFVLIVSKYLMDSCGPCHLSFVNFNWTTIHVSTCKFSKTEG